VEAGVTKHAHCFLALCLCLLWSVRSAGQQSLDVLEIPSQFKLDFEAAARLRPQLMAQSHPASEHYSTGNLVLNRLVEQVPAPSRSGFQWQLRIVDDDDLNAYASPDGTAYVDRGLARLAGPSAGLWAAILSHEVAHILRRDWARRYLYQKALENRGGGVVALGDPGMPAPSWVDSEKASQDLARFCREMELEADRGGLTLMARAGYHPDFVPALHHLLHARGSRTSTASLYAMHPCWEERDEELSRAYVAASIEFENRWREWYASPGGNPPVVVFAEQPKLKKTSSKEWLVEIPMRCENLSGAVAVVLHADSVGEQFAGPPRPPGSRGTDGEVRQLTGCTSPRTTVTFILPDGEARRKPGTIWTDVYVLDAWGAVLARTDMPKFPR